MGQKFSLHKKLPGNARHIIHGTSTQVILYKQNLYTYALHNKRRHDNKLFGKKYSENKITNDTKQRTNCFLLQDE